MVWVGISIASASKVVLSLDFLSENATAPQKWMYSELLTPTPSVRQSSQKGKCGKEKKEFSGFFLVIHLTNLEALLSSHSVKYVPVAKSWDKVILRS